jgi:hypothetical protein
MPDTNALQRAMLPTLKTLLDRGLAAGADALTWVIGVNGFTGEVFSLGGGKNAQHLATFETWVKLLGPGAERKPVQVSEDGRQRHVAHCSYGTGAFLHVVVLRLELQPTFVDTVVAHCRWALAHNAGNPNPVWSDREQLAVALVLNNLPRMKALGCADADQAARMVYDGMEDPPAAAEFPGLIDSIRQRLNA